MFRYCETKQLRLKNVNQPPLLSLTFFDTRIWWNSKGFPYEIFSALRQDTFDPKWWYPPPVLSINFFATGNFLKHSTEGFPTIFFGTVRQKNLRRKTLDTPLPPLFHKLFRYRKFSETHHRRLPQRNFSGTVRQKIFDGKPWYSPPPPPLFSIHFRSLNLSETLHRRVPLRNVSVLWDKKCSTENCGITLWRIISMPETSDNRGFPYEFFGTGRWKVFDGKSWFSPHHKLFRNRKFSETQHRRVSLRSFSALRDTKFFNGKSWYLFA